jgi:hypothetical protein
MVLSISAPHAAPLSDPRFMWSGCSVGARKLDSTMGTDVVFTATVFTDVNAAWRPLKPPKRTSG